jgi:hypothetical protein
VDLAEERPAGAPGRTWAIRHRAAITAGAVLVAVLAFLVWQLGLVALLLAVCLLAGLGITYLSGLDLLFEERFFFGAVIGAMAVTGAGYLAALAMGELTYGTVNAGATAALALSAAGWVRGRALIGPDLADLRDRWLRHPRAAGHPWPLAAVLLISWAYTYRLISQAWTYRSDGLWAGNPSVWGDWAAHLAYAGSFAYGHNFPPQFPIDPGHRLGYPFMIDFFAAGLIPLGAWLTSSLTITSGFLALAFPAVMYLAGVRFLASRAAAALGFFVFVLMGGLGFTYFLADVDKSGWGILGQLPREYTHIDQFNYQWLNPILASLLPQRSTLFGFSLCLITLALLYQAKDLPGRAWTPFVFAGVLAGLTPAFHIHAFGTALALAFFWALFKRRLEWIGFLAPAIILAAPVLAWLWPTHGSFIQPAVGWLATNGGHHDSWVWFWIKNTGLFIPLLLAGQFLRGLLATGFQRYFAPVWLWFAVPNLYTFHPWPWDNQKFFIFWALLGAFLIGAVLVRLFKGGPAAAVLAAALLGLLCWAGAMDAARDADPTVASLNFTDKTGLEAATWARDHTEPHAIFLTAADHNEPIASLSGRAVVLGYPGWVWSYGLDDWGFKEAAVRQMLRGEPGTPEQLRAYHVDYVVLGPHERSRNWGANETYWAGHGSLVYSNSEYIIYRVT